MTDLAHRKVELVIAGHAHGGQWRFFGQGLFAPGQGILPRFTGGLYRGRKHLRGQAAPLSSESPLLLVSRGLGNQIRIPRLWNREELVYIDFCEE